MLFATAVAGIGALEAIGIGAAIAAVYGASVAETFRDVHSGIRGAESVSAEEAASILEIIRSNQGDPFVSSTAGDLAEGMKGFGNAIPHSDEGSFDWDEDWGNIEDVPLPEHVAQMYEGVTALGNSLKPDDNCETLRQKVIQARLLQSRLIDEPYPSQFIGHEDVSGSYGVVDKMTQEYERKCGKTSNWFRWQDGKTEATELGNKGWRISSRAQGTWDQSTVHTSVATAVKGRQPYAVIIDYIGQSINIIF